MSTSLTVNSISAAINWILSFTPTGQAQISSQQSLSYTHALSQGTGAADTADRIYAAQVTIAGAGNTSLNFNSGLSDAFGNAIVMARVKYLYVHHTKLTAAS